MELKKATRSYQLSQVILDKTFEQTVESEFILPDYLAEIVRIVKCMGTPHIVSKQRADQKIILDGYVHFHLLYTSEDGAKLYSFEQSIPFTKQIDAKVAVEDALVETAVKGEYINCRATNPRAISVRSSVSIRVKAVGKAEQTVLSDVSGMGVQMKKERFSATVPAASGQKAFSLEDETDLALSSPPEAVLGVDSYLSIDDYKVITGKVILKGECRNHVSYLLQNNQVESADYTIPVSQIVDIENCSADMAFSVRAAGLDCKAELKQNIEGENTVLSTQMVCEASVVCYRQEEIETIRDLFSTTFESEYKTRPFTASSVSILPKQAFTVTRQVKLDGPALTTVYDVWGEVNLLIQKMEEGVLVAAGNVKATVIGADGEGTLHFSEKNVDFETRIPAPGDGQNQTADLTVKLAGSSASLAPDGGAELRFDLEGEAVLTSTFTGNVVEDLSVDEESPKETDKNIALTIYYCDRGEDVWQIAKRYNTSVEGIVQENSLEGDTVPEKRTLLIPIVSE